MLSTAGPFALLGTPVVDAAVRSGCHYVDITGKGPGPQGRQEVPRWGALERRRDRPTWMCVLHGAPVPRCLAHWGPGPAQRSPSACF